MTIEIEVEFPVVTRAFSRGGGSKLIMGTVDLTARIPELEEAAVPVAASVARMRGPNEEFRIDGTGQFYWRLGSSPEDERTFWAGFGNLYFDQPGLLRMRDVGDFFGRPERQSLKELFAKRDIAKPRRIADRKRGSYDQALVDAQVAERIEVLQRYALIGRHLFLRSQEPLLRVSRFGEIYFEHGDPWQTLAPHQCFSLRELPEAIDLASRIQGKTPADQPMVQILDEEKLSPSYLHERVALVNRYVLDLVQQYIARSSVDEVGHYLSRLADVIEFLREAWDERPVSLQASSFGRCHGS